MWRVLILQALRAMDLEPNHRDSQFRLPAMANLCCQGMFMSPDGFQTEVKVGGQRLNWPLMSGMVSVLSFPMLFVRFAQICGCRWYPIDE